MSAGLRFRLHLALLVLLAVAAVLTAASWDHPIRLLAAVLVAALVPGGALLARAPVDDVVAWLGLAVGLSLAVDAALSLGLVWLDHWNPQALAAALGAVSATLLLSNLRRGGPKIATRADGDGVHVTLSRTERGALVRTFHAAPVVEERSSVPHGRGAQNAGDNDR